MSLAHPSSSERTYDVAILGGGVIGLFSAYYCAKAGLSVCLVDQRDLGHGSSRHNAGYVSPSHFVPLASPGMFFKGLKCMFNPVSPLYIKPRLDPALFSWGWKFARACGEEQVRRAMPVLRDLLLESRRLYEVFASDEHLVFGMTKNGLTVLCASEAGMRGLQHEEGLAHGLGVEARIRDRNGLREDDPKIEFAAIGGLHFPIDMHLDPALMVAKLIAVVESQGVNLLPNEPVGSIERIGETVTGFVARHGTIRAKQFVLAAGAWSRDIVRHLGIRLPLEAGKGYSVTLPMPGVTMRLPYILQERRVAVTPLDGVIRFAGTMEIAGVDESVTQPRVEAILDAVPLYFANIGRPVAAQGMVWSGLRPVSPDGLPYLGRTRDFPNLIMACGHAMVGMSLGTVTGKIVAEIVKGTLPSGDITLLNPDRYN
jgi:D-amino-acid dehydrogenase